MLLCRLCKNLQADFIYEDCDTNIIPSLCSFHTVDEESDICDCKNFKIIDDVDKYLDIIFKKTK